MRTSSLSKPKWNALIALFSVIFSVFISEMFLRVFFIQETKRLAIYDKDLGWRGEPNGQGIFIRKNDNIRAQFKYNKYGFRDEDFTTKSNSVTRIILTGDSFVEGLEVEYENTFHKKLEKQINQDFNGYFEVINLSSQGYSTAQELLALRRYKDIVQADIVLLNFFTGNDFTENLREKFVYLDEEGILRYNKETDSWLEEKYFTFRRWIYEHSHVVFFLKNSIEFIAQVPITDDAKKINTKNLTICDACTITKLLILEMKNEVESNYAKFGVIIIPSKEEIAVKGEQYTNLIVELCKIQQIPYLDLRDVLSTDYYYKYDGHLNELGHATVAKETYKFLSSQFGLF